MCLYVATQGAPTDIQGSDVSRDFWVGRFTGCEVSVGLQFLAIGSTTGICRLPLCVDLLEVRDPSH